MTISRQIEDRYAFVLGCQEARIARTRDGEFNVASFFQSIPFLITRDASRRAWLSKRSPKP